MNTQLRAEELHDKVRPINRQYRPVMDVPALRVDRQELLPNIRLLQLVQLREIPLDDKRVHQAVEIASLPVDVLARAGAVVPEAGLLLSDELG